MYTLDYIQLVLRIFVCDVDKIPKKELYLNVKYDYNLVHEGAHIEMLLLNYGLNGKKKIYMAASFCFN